jgi:hypothetical protein
MMMAIWDLGHDHHERPTLVMRTQRIGKAYLGLVEAV